MVALERVHEFSTLPQEPPEFMEPRPPATWPLEGKIEVSDLVIRYAVSLLYRLLDMFSLLITKLQPDLPNVLHNLNFSVEVCVFILPLHSVLTYTYCLGWLQNWCVSPHPIYSTFLLLTASFLDKVFSVGLAVSIVSIVKDAQLNNAS